MHKKATKCNKTQSKLRINKHEASQIIDTFETYQQLFQKHAYSSKAGVTSMSPGESAATDNATVTDGVPRSTVS
jgi:ArsR family metal-binding transcriptional regulator